MDSKLPLKFCMCFECSMSYVWDNFYSYNPSSQFSVHPSVMCCETGSWILLWPLRNIKNLLFVLQLETSKMQAWLPPCLCID